MGRLYPLFVLLIAAGPPGCAAQQDLVTKASSGPSLHQAPDGSWLQAVELQGGASGLRDAFARQMVTVDCPSSQLFEVTISSSHPESGTSWQRVRQCGTQMPEGASAAADSRCTISAPAAVASTIVIRQPGDLSDRVAGPEPCTLTLQAGTSPHLLLATLLGAALLLRGQRWCRTRAGAALTRICCVGLPLLTALAGTALLASLAVTSTAGMEWVLAQLPVQPPKELWGAAVVAIAAVTGIATALSVVCACVALQLQGLAVAAAPWVVQLLGAVLICSNCQELNWAVRGACTLWLLCGCYRARLASRTQPSGVAAAAEKLE